MYFLEKVRFPKMRVLGGLQKKSNSVEILSYFTDSHRVQFFLALFLNGMYGSYSTIVTTTACLPIWKLMFFKKLLKKVMLWIYILTLY